MTTLDPYAELDIRKAHKRRVKQTHPDKGGTPAAFERTQRALSVLTDPARREKFDRTGTVEDEKPDNDRASALQIIEAQLANLLNGYLASGGRLDADPRFVDVPSRIIETLRTEVSKHMASIVEGERAMKFFADMRDRFERKKNAKGADFVRRSLEGQAARAEQQLSQIREGIRIRELAIEMISDYKFRKDDAPQRPLYYEMTVDIFR